MLDRSKDSDAPGQQPQAADRDAQRTSLSGRRTLRSPSEALQPVSAPPPPKSSKRKRRPLIATASGLLSFIGIAAIALAVAWSLGVQRINSAGPLTSDKVVTIRQGSDISVWDQLANAGVIDSPLLMNAALWIEGNRGNVKAGEYMFKQSASLRDVMDTVISGKQILHAITLPEGLTSEQVVDRLRENDVLVGDIKTMPEEGTLMPDTYKFARGTTRDQVIRTMQAEQKRVLSEVWARRSTDTPIHSPFELVTMASIVEKETGRADERPRVAGVFVNRLARGMPLQSDPTIVYGLVGGKGTLGRGILRSELEQKTPYNTYFITGLPPGPIANPGKAALEAVANPSRTKDLYFVADGTGGHAFADNLDQHRLNVQRWRQIEKDAKDKLSPDNTPAPASGTALPRNNQRGALDAEPPVYGGLDPVATGIATPKPALVTSFSFDNFSNAGTAAFKTAASSKSKTTSSGNFDELDVEVAGVRSKSDPASWGDGDGAGPTMPDDASAFAAGSALTFPVSPERLAQQRAEAQALGLQPGFGRSADQSTSPPEAAPARLYGKGRIVDASEGTSFDPLRDKTYDLSSPKIVPAIKPLPPITSAN